MAKSKPEEITLPYNFIPRDYQLELFKAMDGGKKRALLRWCRRAGKDKTCFNYLVKRAFTEVGLYYYFFPSYSQGRKALWEAIQEGEKLLDHIPKGMAKFNNNELKIELINGSLIRVIGTDNYDSIVGTNPIGMVFSEYSLQDPRAWHFLVPILAQNGGWAIFNGTPRGENHMFELETSIQGKKEWFFSEVQTLWPDLPNYKEVATIDAIEQSRIAGMTEETIESEYGVSYKAGRKGAYYADCIKRARESGRVGNYDYDPALPVDTFWDLGRNDSTSIWFRQVQGNRKVFIDYYEASNESPNHYAEVLADKGYYYGRHYMPHDAGHQRLEGCLKNIFRTCFDAVRISSVIILAKKVQLKRDAINAVRMEFGKYFFSEDKCAKALMLLSLYHRKYDEKLQTFLDTPVHDSSSHCADALSTEALTASHNTPGQTSNVQVISAFNPLERNDDQNRGY